MSDRGAVGRRSQYEAIVDAYERHAEVRPYNALYDRPAVLALIGDVSGRRVLDAGCGSGLYAEQLVARGAEVVAFDQSPPRVMRLTPESHRGRLADGALPRGCRRSGLYSNVCSKR